MPSTKAPMRESQPRSTGIRRALSTVRGRLGEARPRLRQLLRRPSRSAVTYAIALLALLALTLAEVRGMVAFFSVIGLAVLLRSEHIHARRSSESTEAQSHTEVPS